MLLRRGIVYSWLHDGQRLQRRELRLLQLRGHAGDVPKHVLDRWRILRGRRNVSVVFERGDRADLHVRSERIAPRASRRVAL